MVQQVAGGARLALESSGPSDEADVAELGRGEPFEHHGRVLPPGADHLPEEVGERSGIGRCGGVADDAGTGDGVRENQPGDSVGMPGGNRLGDQSHLRRPR